MTTCLFARTISPGWKDGVEDGALVRSYEMPDETLIGDIVFDGMGDGMDIVLGYFCNGNGPFNGRGGSQYISVKDNAEETLDEDEFAVLNVGENE